MLTATEQKIGEFEFVDHGVNGSQYFQGFGTSCTGFEHCATGCGSNPAEAVDDMLESAAQCGWDTEGMEKRILDQCDLDEMPTDGGPCDGCDVGLYSADDAGVDDDYDGDDMTACDGCELHYYTSIRWNAVS